MSFPAIGWGFAPWSFRVTVTVVLPDSGTAVFGAAMDEFEAEASGAKKTTCGACVTVTVSVVSVAEYVTVSAVVSLAVNTACPMASVVAVEPGSRRPRWWNGQSPGTG